jgi:hypothetical protein
MNPYIGEYRICCDSRLIQLWNSDVSIIDLIDKPTLEDIEKWSYLNKQRHIIKLMYFSAFIYHSPYWFRGYSNKIKNRGISIYHLFAKKIGGAHYKDLLSYLIRINSIELTQKYAQGSHSNKYRSICKTLGVQKIDVNTSNFLKKLKTQSLEECINIKNDLSVKNAIYAMKVTQIDWEGYLSGLYSVILANRKDIKPILEAYKIDDPIYHKIIASHSMITHNFWAVRDRFGRRLHTNITNLPKASRPFMQIDEENLVEIDGSNCQLALLMNRFILEKKEALSDIDDGSWNFYLNTIRGVAYEWLNNLPDLKKLTKDQIKKQLLACLFDKNRNQIKYKISSALKKACPDFWEWLFWLKKEDYRDCAKLAQRLESYLFIDLIYKKMSSQSITGHIIYDCIMIPSSKLEKTLNIIKECCDLISLKMSFKIIDQETGELTNWNNLK